jgi:DNA-binding winged helix-turn-helix (wHTH) protein
MRVRFGGFTLDTERREVLRGSESVPLPPKVFQLLEILIASRPRAVPQEELYDALWPDTFVEKTNLHNLVYQLRAALDDEERAVIRTGGLFDNSGRTHRQ